MLILIMIDSLFPQTPKWFYYIVILFYTSLYVIGPPPPPYYECHFTFFFFHLLALKEITITSNPLVAYIYHYSLDLIHLIILGHLSLCLYQ